MSEPRVDRTCLASQAPLERAHELHEESARASDKLERAALYQEALEVRRRRCRHASHCSLCFEDAVLPEVMAA